MAAPLTQASDSPRLDDYLRPILGRIWLIVSILVVVTIATYGYYKRQSPVYAASTQVFLGISDPLQTGGTAGTDRNLENQARLFTTTEVLSRVVKTLNYPGSPQALVHNVTITPSTGSDIITIAARFGDPSGAARLANAFAEAFISTGSAQQQKQIAQAVQALRSQLRDISASQSTASDRLVIITRLHQLQLAQQTGAGSATQVDPASPNAAAISPKPIRNAMFAFALALITSLGLAFGLERFDRRIKRVVDAAELYDLPILTVVPHADGINRVADGLPALSPTVKEAFHQLRTNLQLSSLDCPPRKILVTSGLPREGKSTVVRNLAIVLREWGQSVAVVDADLRNPSLSKLFNVEPEHGLTDVLTGDCSLTDAMTAVPVEALGLATLAKIYAKAADSGRAPAGRPLEQADAAPHGITMIGPGPRPANPAAVLSAAATQEALDELLLTHDIVLIDSPPLLPVSDAMSLLSTVDAVVLVSRLSVTTKDSARRTTEVIARVADATVAGVVVNDLSGLEGMGYGYGYGNGYGGEYGSRESDPR
jgi:Mrp family chromosome partitioning ATPase/capsular polysaccharide biosynthesis protein